MLRPQKPTESKPNSKTTTYDNRLAYFHQQAWQIELDLPGLLPFQNAQRLFYRVAKY